MECPLGSKALSDLARLDGFLEPVDATAAARAVQILTAAPVTLQANPCIGRRVQAPASHEVRRPLAAVHELRKESEGGAIFIVRMFCTRGR
jgi:hypothetical protein